MAYSCGFCVVHIRNLEMAVTQVVFVLGPGSKLVCHHHTPNMLKSVLICVFDVLQWVENDVSLLTGV